MNAHKRSKRQAALLGNKRLANKRKELRAKLLSTNFKRLTPPMFRFFKREKVSPDETELKTLRASPVVLGTGREEKPYRTRRTGRFTLSKSQRKPKPTGKIDISSDDSSKSFIFHDNPYSFVLANQLFL